MTRAPSLPRSTILASVAVVVLAAFASVVGVIGDVYRDAAILLPQLYGQDLLTLVVAVPALVVSLRAASRGSLRGYVVWLGVTGYVLYTYATYAFMTAFNPLYLAYVALLGLTLFTFVDGLRRVDATQFRRVVDPLGVRPYVAFQAGLAVLVGVLWLAEILPATVAGSVPASVADANVPVNVIHSLDLGVVLPAFALSAYWLARRHAFGYVTTAVLLVKAVTLAGAILAMAVVMTLDGQTVPAPQIVIFGGLAIASSALLVRLLRAIDTEPGVEPASGRRGTTESV